MKIRLNHLPAATLILSCMPSLAQELQAPSKEPAQTETRNPTKELVNKINETTGLEFWGYGRGGGYGASRGQPKGGYSLGGDLQKYRLGNEGDNYLEFGIGKKFTLGDGIKLGVFYMPTIYNGKSGTAQAYFSLSGIFGSTATLWAGQRYHRIQDVHILDKWILEDGDNYGAGIDDIALEGLGRLNAAIYTADSIDNKSGNPNNAKRFNLQWRDIPSNHNGKLTLTAALVSGDFAQGSHGVAFGLMHQQKDFLLPRLNNTVVLQASNGHAAINGKFFNLDLSSLQKSANFGLGTAVSASQASATNTTQQPSARQYRVLDTLDFQFGKWGGQALIGYQSMHPDNSVATRDFSLGGRMSYGIAKYTKLLGEFGTTRRSIKNQPQQTLNKATLAIAISPDTNFWTRPEVRIYATHANWNKSAGSANTTSFGANGRRGATSFGVQAEVWWE